MKRHVMAALLSAAMGLVCLGCGAAEDGVNLCPAAPQCHERVEACGLATMPDGEECVLENGEEGVCGAGECVPVCAADDKNECTADSCIDGAPNHVDRAAGSSCMNGACDGYGACLPGEVEGLSACEGPDFRSGWLVNNKCVECAKWSCAGVPGCSANPIFADMLSVGQCPTGCFPACPL